MKRKIIGILFCTLLIGATGVVVADWYEGEEYKMHYPQLPYPNGVDVDWGWWYLGDDWKCTECGLVEDIHFWISWFNDDPKTIPRIDVSIWSNEPRGPQGWSQPRDLLWQRQFFQGQFIVAGPFGGVQQWMMPNGTIIPQVHNLFFQINIKDIDDPFEQMQDEIYWLVIKMPFSTNYTVGWKNTTNYFMDYAVWCEELGYNWTMIDGIDFAFVINGESNKPDLECNGLLSWIDVPAGGTVTGNFEVCNFGETCSKLDWEIDTTTPGFGNWTFTPVSGTDLAEGDCITVTATCIVPPDKNTEFMGNIKLFNSNNPSDYCKIYVYLKTPKSKSIHTTFLLRILERYPNAFIVLRQLLGM